VSGYVLDASVAAKWFLPSHGETYVREALTIFQAFAAGKTGLLVPDLFWPEISTVFWKACRLGRMSEKAADEAISSLAAQQIVTAPSRPLVNKAFAIAAAFKRPVYDAIYVALAVGSNCPLVTADECLANALATYFPIRWLGAL
jgi:predicted nucleic acid-binding protein